MLERLFVVPNDPLLKLIGAFRSDPRPHKIDLGVGVYRNALGQTPVMKAVKQAERQLIETQDSKAYIGLAGDVEFLDEMGYLVFGGIRPKKSRFAYIQTPGCSAALRLAGDIIHRSNPSAAVWTGLPCWTNHIPIFKAANLQVKTYSYYDAENKSLDREALFSQLSGAAAGDIVLLQGCCHNPTGVDLTLEDWKTLTALCLEKHLIPLIDIAYHGLGDGLAEDLAGVNQIMNAVPEAMITVSCSKSFGLYRDRVGALYVMADSIKKAEVSLTNLFELARTSYSMPPDHGAAVVRTILRDPALRQMWEDELSEMRERIGATRQSIIERCDPKRLKFMETNKGMFSLLPLSQAQIDSLRDDHAIYMADNGRINVAGLPPESLGRFVDAVRPLLSD